MTAEEIHEKYKKQLEDLDANTQVDRWTRAVVFSVIMREWGIELDELGGKPRNARIINISV